MLSTNLLSARIILYDNILKLDNFFIEHYHDKVQEMNITTIQKVKFNIVNNKFTFGYIYGDSWFKVTINNQSQDSDFILYLTESFYKDVKLFEYYDDKWVTQSSGILKYIKNGDNRYINPTFKITIQPKTSKIFYIQIHSKPTDKISTYGEFLLYTQKEFIFHTINDKLIYLLYFGSMSIIIILNIFIFIIFREAIFIYYVAYIFFHSIFVLSYSGLDTYIGLAKWHLSLNIAVPLFSIFFALFAISFLNTKKYLPIVDKILKIAISLVSILIPFIIIDDNIWFDLVSKICTLFVPLVLFSAIYLFIKGHLEVKYYVVAIIIYIISLVSLSLMTEGIIPNSNYNHYAFIFGSYIEVIFFFFILINKFYIMHTELILLKDRNEEILEAKIEVRTKEISKLLCEKDLLLKEVYHRVKNNFQIVISLLWIESSKEMNRDNKNLFQDIINRIKSMSLVHTYLLKSKTLSEIESQEYLAQIINQTKNIYHNINIKTEVDSCYLNIDEALSLGIIINEILNNSAKHHNNIGECKINLFFKVNKTNVKLLIEDNGAGYILENKVNGFGIKMVEEFAQKLKYSNIIFSAKNGTLFILEFEI
jgi:two-component sensor histidine kinase